LDPEKDSLYSEYIKVHAWKLSVVTAHNVGPFKKLILGVTKHLANTADSPAFTYAQCIILSKYLINGGIFLHGDQAYMDDNYVLPPYASARISASPGHIQTEMLHYNTVHSSHRVCAEHGIGALKKWAIVRGRSDKRIFEDDKTFSDALHVCWGLTNFLILHRQRSNLTGQT
jgi:hypothetical protein